ncbi:MAG: hypothetical protein R3E08_11410 [Thiotrichaceae bacterium]
MSVRFELVESIANKHNCNIVVLDESKLSPQAELVNDLLPSSTSSRRINGLRKYGRKIKEDFPDLSQNKHLARKYLGLSRWWYNRTINYLNQPDTKASLFEVRKIVQKGDDIQNGRLIVHKEFVNTLCSDACNAVKNAKLKCQKTGKFQKVSFRARRDPIQSFGFDANSIHQDFVFGKAGI